MGETCGITSSNRLAMTAYASNISGQMSVYIEPYPPSGAKWQVSSSGGLMPRWRRDGKELFYVTTADERMYAVTIKADSQGVETGTPAALFPTHLRQVTGYQYDVSADGKKFLLNAAKGGDDKTTITLVTNWTSSFRR